MEKTVADADNGKSGFNVMIKSIIKYLIKYN